MVCHFLPPGDLPNPGIEPTPLALAGAFFTTKPSRKPHFILKETLFEAGKLVSSIVQVTKEQAS